MADFSKLMERKAAALKYDSEKNGAPMIVAAGMGHMAEKITETAMKAGVPVYEDDSLASLLTQMKLGAEIPEELFQAIVEIYIYFLGFTGDAEKDKEEQEKRREERRIRELQKNEAGHEEQSGQEKETKIRERLSS
jgi:possible flagellar biosynthesis protein flhB